jgi:xanthine dehydrogenase YagT iron-sulfur-binding subunit
MTKKRPPGHKPNQPDSAANVPGPSATSGQKGLVKGFTRRGFMQGVGAASGAAALSKEAKAAQSKVMGPKKLAITLNVNGKDHKLKVEPRVTLLRALRNELDLTGSKEVCDRGSCGACSVMIDGDLVTSCMVLAVDAIGKRVLTIEGLSKGDELHPIQQAFVQHDALQCGFCTPGMVMACKALLDTTPKPTLVQIKKGLSGNICRCGTYNNIFAAVATASKTLA